MRGEWAKIRRGGRWWEAHNEANGEILECQSLGPLMVALNAWLMADRECPHQWHFTAWKRTWGEYWDVAARCSSCGQTRREKMVGSPTVINTLGWLPAGDYDPFGDLEDANG